MPCGIEDEVVTTVPCGVMYVFGDAAMTSTGEEPVEDVEGLFWIISLGFGVNGRMNSSLLNS